MDFTCGGSAQNGVLGSLHGFGFTVQDRMCAPLPRGLLRTRGPCNACKGSRLGWPLGCSLRWPPAARVLCLQDPKVNDIYVDSKQLSELTEQKNELLSKVGAQQQQQKSL